MAYYALTIFCGAFLLFQVQPLLGKYILPWFGGGPGVWTTCMLFFQVMLVGGYAYAHGAARWLRPKKQVVLQLVLLAAALISLPIIPSEAWKPGPADSPSLRILALLAATIGLPYLVLSSTGPLMQHWFTVSCPGKSPYRLFALSNVGSLAALVSYPFYFESHFTRRTQATLWSVGLVIYAVSTAVAGWQVWKNAGRAIQAPAGVVPQETVQQATQGRHGPMDWVLWLLLPACASALLLATTNKLCLDVAVVPFLWVLPLAVYLLSFIVAFDSPRWYRRLPFTFGLGAALAAYCWALHIGSDWPVWRQASVYGVALFLCCMVCHGELYRLRPAPQGLTAYYLMISVGGALGGVFVALVAPAIFVGYFELHWMLFLCAGLFLAIIAFRPQGISERYWRWVGRGAPVAAAIGIDFWMRQLLPAAGANKMYFQMLRVAIWVVLGLLVCTWFIKRNGKPGRWPVLLWLSFGTLWLGFALWNNARERDPDVMLRCRNFYGALTVFDYNRNDPDSHHYMLQHGRITHGLQFTENDQRYWATTYFGQETGVGIAMRTLEAGKRRVGIVGLGTGTLASYGQSGDYIKFYEINPQVEVIANHPFSYLKESGGKVEIARGDARLAMEREPAQNYNLLILDAFSSDSIPVHLLTREAFEVYNKHLQTNSILAIHISNHYLDLEPIVHELAENAGYHTVMIDYQERDDSWWVYSATWMLLSKNPDMLKAELITKSATPLRPLKAGTQLWTDDFASLFPIFMK